MKNLRPHRLVKTFAVVGMVLAVVLTLYLRSHMNIPVR